MILSNRQESKFLTLACTRENEKNKTLTNDMLGTTSQTHQMLDVSRKRLGIDKKGA